MLNALLKVFFVKKSLAFIFPAATDHSFTIVPGSLLLALLAFSIEIK